MIIISGGYGYSSDDYEYSVELYNPKTGSTCLLPDLPDYRVSPVGTGLKVCGGNWDSMNCLLYAGGNWVIANILTTNRVGSSNYESSHGPIIMGGYDTAANAEALGLSGEYSSEVHFELTSER